MGTDKVGILFRLAIILLLICIINLFFIDPGQPEFYILIMTICINLVVVIVSYIYIKRKSDK